MLHKNAVEPSTLELLIQICKLPSLKNFALGGGTNLALQIGHRFSIDLDFFTSTSYDNTGVFKTITQKYPSAELIFEQNQTMMFHIEGVKVDFVLYPFEWLYSFKEIEEARLINITDIIPMKLQALSNRFAKKDFWDIAFLLKRFSLEEIMKIFKTKFPQVDTGYIIHSLTYFETAEKEDDPINLVPINWNDIKEFLQKTVSDYTRKLL